MNDNKERNTSTGNGNLPSAMNRRQAEVFELLQGFASDGEKFHEWYQGALESLASNFPDRIAQAAHSLRELCDRLPKAIGNIPEFRSPISAVKPLGPRFLEVKKQFYLSGWKGDINQPLDVILTHFEKLFGEPPRTKRLGKALESTDPHAEFLSVKMRRERDAAFEEVVNFFQNVAHHNRSCNETEFRTQLDLFESFLLNYLTPCTASQQNELRALILGGPTQENIIRVNELVSIKGANCIYFFEKLDNPNWLQPLEQQGYFLDLPKPELLKDGKFAYQIHVPLICLIKLAETAPKEVVSVLEKLKLPDNPRIGDQVLQCMAKIRDATNVLKLRPLVRQLSENLNRTSWVWIRELLQNWIALNAIADVFSITERYLVASVELSFGDLHNHHNDWLMKQIDEQVLDGLTAKYSFEVGVVVCRALTRWTQLNQQKHQDSDDCENSSSTTWIEDFKETPEDSRELEGTLAVRLFKAGEQVFRNADRSKIVELDHLLLANHSALFARLRWQLYADFPSQTLDWARRDVLARIPRLDREDCRHNYEFAQMLHSHAGLHRAAFLSPGEVLEFFEAVFRGPLDVDGECTADYSDGFRLKQLWPISMLLQGKELESYRELLSAEAQIKLKDYKPFCSEGGARMIEHVAPEEAGHLVSMPPAQLWSFLNNWQPKGRVWPKWWVEEDFDSLATKFAEFIENQPERFNPADTWWENLNRPALLYKFLERVSKRIDRKAEPGETSALPPTEQDWANWFGVAKWTTSQRPITGTKENDELDWTWARIVVATFLQVVLRSKFQLPEIYQLEINALLQDLIHQEDSRLDNRDTAGMGDWLSTAINSVRGDALEALVQLALNQKNTGKVVDPWIFEIIKSRLELKTESPAVFALLGSKLRVLIHLFESRLKEKPELIFPPDRPTHQRAAIIAHFSYDNPWSKVLQVFPSLIESALKIHKAMRVEAKDDEQKENRRDFGSQLGTHIACYYWNSSFPSDAEGEKALDRFFADASKSTRANVINRIARIWEDASHEKQNDYEIARVMRFWERRFGSIIKSIKKNAGSMPSYEKELAAVTRWLSCDCFPFEWRVAQAKQALEPLQKAPESYHLFKAIYEYGTQRERLESMLQILRLILARPSDQLRWSLESEKLRPVISLGLMSETPGIKKLAQECLDSLLKMGFSEFLNH